MAILAWAHERRIASRYIQPGKPVQNAFAESLNARLCDELLNEPTLNMSRHEQVSCSAPYPHEMRLRNSIIAGRFCSNRYR
jgi:putative transposase